MASPMRDRFAAVTSRALDEDPRIAVVLAEISTDRFAPAAARHPERVINVGIREQLLVSVAGGLGLAGLRPVAHTYAPFLVERAFEQVKLDLGHQDVGAVLVSVGGSYDASDSGRTHHAPEDVALVGSLPGWTVHLPGHPDELESMLERAFRSDDRVYIRLSESVNAEPHAAHGWLTLLRRGRSATVVAVGPVLDAVLEATAELDVTVLYASTVRPFDGATLRGLVADGSPVVLVEPTLAGTSSAQVSDALRDVPHRLLALGVRDPELRRYGRPAEHQAAQGLDAAGIQASIDGFLR